MQSNKDLEGMRLQRHDLHCAVACGEILGAQSKAFHAFTDLKKVYDSRAVASKLIVVRPSCGCIEDGGVGGVRAKLAL